MRNIVAKDPPTLPSKYSSELRDFVDCCLKKEPKKRWSAT
jgi:serine/threonine protein kinase